MKTLNFIEKAKQVHSDKYDYSKVEYINSKAKVCIICPEHGEFWQEAMSHLRGCGCKKCANSNNNRIKPFTTLEFIKKAKEVHGDKYDYSKVEYVNNHTKVCIICPEHGEVYITPQTHLRGCGCPKCSVLLKHQNQPITTEEFIRKAMEVHGNKYDYSKTEYINAKTKICIICSKHGEFWQIPNEHLRGRGCPLCNESKLEIEIREFLKYHQIKFIEQKKFKWLGKMRLDFYLPEYKSAIECQGIQHFKEVEWFGIGNLDKISNRDNIKYNLCKSNNIKVFYFSNLNIKYPYTVYEDKNNLLKQITNGK